MSLLELHDSALKPALFRALRRRVVELGSERLRSTYQTTFWFPLHGLGSATQVEGASKGVRSAAGGLVAPLCLPELAAASLRPLVPVGAEVVGVEWWLSRMRTSNVRVDFHVDRDEKLALRAGRIVSPLWSSVLFLNRCEGGLLAVTEQPPCEENPAKAPFLIDFELARPRPNRFAVFPGWATHGVLDADNAIPGRRIRRKAPMRYAVIFNWWRKRPTDVPMWAETSLYRSLGRRASQSS